MTDQGLRECRGPDARSAASGPRRSGSSSTTTSSSRRARCGTIPEDSIEPLGEIQALGEVQVTDEEARRALSQTAVIKLNGGLGTGMGMTGAKSALEVRDGLTFLDIIALQVLALRERWGVQLPLVLMNSFRTSEESLKILAKYPTRSPSTGSRSTSSRTPSPSSPPATSRRSVAARPRARVVPARDTATSTSPSSPRACSTPCWRRGSAIAFLSNSDNLGATCDPDVAAWMVEHGLPYVAEVCHAHQERPQGWTPRGPQVRRPPHPARHRHGRRRRGAVLRRHHATRHLQRQQRLGRPGVLRSACRRARACSDCRSSSTARTSTPPTPPLPRCIQIESAMGAAIEVFEGSEAMLVPRTRFRPVKTTNDLLVLRSDYFVPRRQLPRRRGGRGPGAATSTSTRRTASCRASSSASRTACPRWWSARACASSATPSSDAMSPCVGDVLVDGLRRVPRRRRARGADPARAVHASRPGADLRTVDQHLQAILSSLEPAPDRRPSRSPRRSGSSSRRTFGPGSTCRASTTRRWTGMPSVADSLAGADEAAGAAADRRRGRRRVCDPTLLGGPGEAARIMTGATDPPGRRRRHRGRGHRRIGDRVRSSAASVAGGRYVRPRGEDVAEGAVVVSAGDIVGPRTIAAARRLRARRGRGAPSAARRHPLHRRRARRPGSTAWAPARSTTPTRRCCGLPRWPQERPPRSARPSATPRRSCSPRWMTSSASADVIITSGGVSMGAYDVVKSALRRRGRGVRQGGDAAGQAAGLRPPRPGPEAGGCPLFALPGNPVSSFVSFEVFVRPGPASAHAPHAGEAPAARRHADDGAALAGRAPPVRPGRRVAQAPRVRCSRAPVAGQGSHFVADLSRANALFIVPEDVRDLVAGEPSTSSSSTADLGVQRLPRQRRAGRSARRTTLARRAGSCPSVPAGAVT